MEIGMFCQNCKHFYQHYVKVGRGRYDKCSSGHCCCPRRKLRYNNAKACQHYVPKDCSP